MAIYAGILAIVYVTATQQVVHFAVSRYDAANVQIGITELYEVAKRLKEMFEDIDENLMKYVEDYKVNLLVPNEIRDFDKFTTDFGKVMKYIAVSNDKNALKELYKTGEYRGNAELKLVHEVVEGQAIVATAKYTPSKNAKNGTWIAFGIEA